MSSYEVRCPAHVMDIVSILLDLGRSLEAVEGGVYQWSGMEKLSKWDIVKMLGAELELNIDHLEEVKGMNIKEGEKI